MDHQTTRLVGGENAREGRVEVFHDGEWGTVCDDGWARTDKNARVVCRELGFPHTDAQVASYRQFGVGEGPIWLDDVDCDGSEDELSECGHREWGSNDCGRGENVGVICGGK